MKNIEVIAIGQGGGPTAVINDQVAGALYEAQNAGKKVYALRSGLEGMLHADAGNVFDISHWDPSKVRSSPGAILHTTRIKLKKGNDDEKIEQIRKNIERLGIDSMVYFGGNDSSYILQALGMGVHGSKTIDNDLPLAHHTPGYGSAALFHAITVRNLALDIGSYRVIGNNGHPNVFLNAPITIYQSMGRNTGWIALACAFARVMPDGEMNQKLPPDIIWTRETPFDEDRFLGSLSDVLTRKGKAFVVIGEELVNKDGTPLSEIYGNDATDPHGHVQHARSGAFNYADFLARLAKKVQVSNVNEIKETPLAPQHMQRVYRSEVDANEAFEVGRHAVRAVLDGHDQVSIVIKSDGHVSYERVPIGAIAGKTRSVPLEYIDGIRGPTPEFVREFLPVIGGASSLPHYWKPDFSRQILPRY